MFKRKRFLEYTFIVTGLILFVVFVAKAVAQNVTQGYLSDAPIQQGIIVRLKAGDAAKVAPVSQTDEIDILGVVVSPSDAPA